eukprot:scaffold26041_cov131-Skeletonema_marinoi.AAC.2
MRSSSSCLSALTQLQVARSMVFFYDQGIRLLVGIVLETGKRGSPSIASLSECMTHRNDATSL